MTKKDLTMVDEVLEGGGSSWLMDEDLQIWLIHLCFIM